jgi:hypothetical protein
MSIYVATIRPWEDIAGLMMAHPATIAVERTDTGLRLVWCHPTSPEAHSMPLTDVHSITFEWEDVTG